MNAKLRPSRTCLPGLEGCAAVIDLSQGSWRARDAAGQLAAALGVELPRVKTLYEAADPEPVARGVDAEARGSLPVLVGARDAQTLCPLLPPNARIGLIADPARQPEDENRWFLTCLQRMGVEMVTLPRGDAPTHDPGLGTAQRALLALYPGRLPPATLAAAGLDPARADLFLAGHPGVIAPWMRHAPGARVSQLIRFQAVDPVLHLLCQIAGPAHYADAEELTALAMSIFRAGAEQLALKGLARACEVAKGQTAAAGAHLSLQGLRIFTHRYSEAAAHDVPADLPPEVAAQLAVLRAWAEMFGPCPGAGLTRIADTLARAGTAAPPGTHDLFVLNIGALGQLRTGQPEAALATERRIENALAAADEIDHRAVFINAINLARLYRKNGEHPACRRQVDRAMATSDGLRSFGDILQMNLIRTWLGVSDAPAAHHVLRASLAWLALSPPEALAIRALRQVAPGVSPGPDMPRRVSEALADRLRTDWPGLEPRAGMRVVAAPDPVPGDSMALQTNGAVVLLLPPGPWAPPLAAPCSARDCLTGLVRAALERDCPALAARREAWIGVDADLGQDIPHGRQGLLSLVQRHHLAQSIGPEGETRWSPEDRLRLAQSARVRRTSGVACIETGGATAHVTFKRYRAPRPLDGTEAVLLAALGQGTHHVRTLAPRAGLSGEAAIAVLARLETARIVRQEVADA